MKVVYYDVLENLIKDIKKRITNNVELDSMKHELIIENQKVKYKEIDIDLRSFSKPFFVDNEIYLNVEKI